MKSLCLLTAILSLIAGPLAIAQQTAPQLDFAPPGEATSTYTVEIVLQGLDHPCGLAIRPGGSPDVAAELYLAERGAGRILKMSTGVPGVTSEVIVGFPGMDLTRGRDGDLPDEDNLQGKGGLLGLLFLTHSKLVVHCQFEAESHVQVESQFLNVYRLPTEDTVLTADQTDHRAGPISTGSVPIGDPTQEEWNWSCGLAKTSKEVFVTSVGESQGWILKASLEANDLTDLQPFFDTTKQTGQSGPASITINPMPRFQYLVVGLMGSMGVLRDSGLAFYSPKSGRLAMNITTGLYDLVGLSYSPEGTLYGIDLAWQVETEGGIYRLDDTLLAGKPSCRAMKIAPVHRPTSMVFAPDGSLYVTAWGPATSEANAESDQKMGVLLKITGEW